MRKTSNSAAFANARIAYSLDLVRGSSYIGSTLSTMTRHAAIIEVIAEFRKLHGDRELALFLQLLAKDLQRRNKPDAASAVLELDLAKLKTAG